MRKKLPLHLSGLCRLALSLMVPALVFAPCCALVFLIPCPPLWWTRASWWKGWGSLWEPPL